MSINKSFIAYSSGGKPDYVVSSDDISLPSPVDEGSSVAIDATIHNNGITWVTIGSVGDYFEFSVTITDTDGNEGEGLHFDLRLRARDNNARVNMTFNDFEVPSFTSAGGAYPGDWVSPEDGWVWKTTQPIGMGAPPRYADEGTHTVRVLLQDADPGGKLDIDWLRILQVGPEYMAYGDPISKTVHLEAEDYDGGLGVDDISPHNVNVGFYDGDPDSGGTYLGQDTTVGDTKYVHDYGQSVYYIRNGDVATASHVWIASPEGTHSIYVKVDPADVIDEQNEGNNKASKSIQVEAATIKVGVIGPGNLGMREGAEMARDEILAKYGREIELAFGNEYSYPTPNPAAAALEVENLITVDECDFIIGGFRSECTDAMIEVAADYGIPFFIVGASADGLIGNTVGLNYARYKYIFRVNPVNGSMLFRNMIASIAYYLLPMKLLPLYGHDLDSNESTPPQVRVAVIMETLTWTDEMYWWLSNPTIYPSILGPNANVTYSASIPEGTTDFTPWLIPLNNSEARLVIYAFSGVSGVPFISQLRALDIKTLPVGINVFGQMKSHWFTTGGACEYETLLSFAGSEEPVVPGVTEVFWNNFYGNYSEWPLYTASGAYQAMHILAEAFSDTGSSDKDALVAYLEDPSYQRQGLSGTFKFTSIHDVYSSEYGPITTSGETRAFFVQWISERLRVVSPVDRVCSKKWMIPTWMYPLIEDITYDGKVDIKDLAPAAKAFGTVPGDPRWEKEADINFDDKVDIKDIATIAKKFGTVITLPLP